MTLKTKRTIVRLFKIYGMWIPQIADEIGVSEISIEIALKHYINRKFTLEKKRKVRK